MMKYIMMTLSIPFFIIGFAWSFAKQGFDDGVRVETNIRKYFTEIDE